LCHAAIHKQFRSRDVALTLTGELLSLGLSPRFAMPFLGPLSFGLADEIEEKAEGDQGDQTCSSSERVTILGA
jgi:hypothetical protein